MSVNCNDNRKCPPPLRKLCLIIFLLSFVSYDSVGVGQTLLVYQRALYANFSGKRFLNHVGISCLIQVKYRESFCEVIWWITF